jgi:opacity protein-like surface antigen
MGNETMKAVAAAFAGIAMAATPSLAADLFGAAPPPISEPGLAEVGSNWYLRGDIGVGFDPGATFSMSGVSTPAQGAGVLPFSGSIGSSGEREDFAADIGVGYRFNNFLRFEATFDYRMGPGGGNSNTVICPYGLTPVGASGYLYDTTNACTGNLDVQQHNSTGLASAYLDLGHYWGVTPYVGAGGGLNANVTSGSVAYTTNVSGGSYNAALATTGTIPQTWVNASGAAISPQPNIAFTQQVWDRSIHSVKYSFAWALMAGVGVQISPSATLDIGYRYLNTGAATTSITPQVGSFMKQSGASQEVRVGIRYMAD